MFTGTNDINEVPKIVKDFLDKGFENIEITLNPNGQWIVSAKK